MDGYLRFDEPAKKDDLEHYGILGMRWGVRNAETRARYARGRGNSRIATTRDYKRLMKTARRQEHEGLTDKQKKALKIAAGTAAVAAVATVSVVALSATLQKSAAARKLVAGGLVTKAKEMTPAKDLACVNRGYLLSEGYRNNCVLCSTAYDLRRRGYDVAAGSSRSGFVQRQFFGEYYKKLDGSPVDSGRMMGQKAKSLWNKYEAEVRSEFAKSNVIGMDKEAFIAIKTEERVAKAMRQVSLKGDVDTLRPSANDVISELAKQGEGARGALSVKWNLFGGHSIAYEVRGGKVHFPDGQINREHDLEKLLKRASSSNSIEYFRLDNAEPDLEKLVADKRVRDTVGAAAVKRYMKK